MAQRAAAAKGLPSLPARLRPPGVCAAAVGAGEGGLRLQPLRIAGGSRMKAPNKVLRHPLLLTQEFSGWPPMR